MTHISYPNTHDTHSQTSLQPLSLALGVAMSGGPGGIGSGGCLGGNLAAGGLPGGLGAGSLGPGGLTAGPLGAGGLEQYANLPAQVCFVCCVGFIQWFFWMLDCLCA